MQSAANCGLAATRSLTSYGSGFAPAPGRTSPYSVRSAGGAKAHSATPWKRLRLFIAKKNADKFRTADRKGRRALLKDALLALVGSNQQFDQLERKQRDERAFFGQKLRDRIAPAVRDIRERDELVGIVLIGAIFAASLAENLYAVSTLMDSAVGTYVQYAVAVVCVSIVPSLDCTTNHQSSSLWLLLLLRSSAAVRVAAERIDD
jgi:hypothetical protein